MQRNCEYLNWMKSLYLCIDILYNSSEIPLQFSALFVVERIAFRKIIVKVEYLYDVNS